MKDKKETDIKVRSDEKDTSKKSTVKENPTCVCNMEWRGPRGDEEGNDCICYPEED